MSIARQAYILLSSSVLICFSIGVSHAGFISVPPPGSNYEIVNTSPKGAIPATVAYNAATELLTANAGFGGSLVSFSPFTVLANDIVGSFSLTASIDHAGDVLGGSFTLSGESPTLGIVGQRVLLSGSILDDGQASGIFQLSGDISAIDPQLQGVVGPAGSAVFDFITGGVSFAGDFTRLTASESPDIFLVAEPPSGAIFACGALLFALIGRRRHRRG